MDDPAKPVRALKNARRAAVYACVIDHVKGARIDYEANGTTYRVFIGCNCQASDCTGYKYIPDGNPGF